MGRFSSSGNGAEPVGSRPVYEVLLRGNGTVRDIHDMKRILKRLLRDDGLKCIGCRMVEAETDDA